MAKSSAKSIPFLHKTSTTLYVQKNDPFRRFLCTRVRSQSCGEWPPRASSKDFLTKMGPMFKDFWWKSNPRPIPACLNMWVHVPPPPGMHAQQPCDYIAVTARFYREYFVSWHGFIFNTYMHKIGPTWTNILFFASPVKTRRYFSQSFS